MPRLNAKQLRELEEKIGKEQAANIKRRPIYLILENVYDTYNVGGLFRLADALAVSKIYLCGDTETPPNSRIKKASIGTYKIVPWKYMKTTKEAIKELRDKNTKIQIVAIEQSKKSLDYRKNIYSFPLALIVGNETYGVLPETLDTLDHIVEIPMYGINKSLNVIVSAAIVAFYASSKLL